MKRPAPRVVVAGGGLAGLTAAACLLQAGREVLVLEKTGQCGGHVASFERQGFTFDAGPRALGNAGILKPLLADLGIDLPLKDSPVSTGIGASVVHHDGAAGVDDYLASLRGLFPGAERDIAAIGRRIRSSMGMARALNTMPNPYFRSSIGGLAGLATRFLPRLPAFMAAVARMSLADEPMERALARLTANPALADMVYQHFFKGTPASFAFGYFENFRDYQYPPGGTGRLPEALARRVAELGGVIRTGVEVARVRPARGLVETAAGGAEPYGQLVWCADLSSLYARLDPEGLTPRNLRAIGAERARFAGTRAGESVFTLFLAVDEDPAAFARVSRGHFIYTPSAEGLGGLHREELDRLKAGFPGLAKDELFAWAREFCRRNSYEIGIPALRDPSLAPPGKTGLVVSLLVDGELFELARDSGWYGELKAVFAGAMLDALEGSVYPGLRRHLLFMDAASPLSLGGRFNTLHGAITGWSLEDRPPVPHSLPGIMGSPRTAVPGVWKAGQWSYSPAGVPIALLTGRVAAGAVLGQPATTFTSKAMMMP